MPKANLIYQGTDITQNVDIIECVMTDVSGGACDCLSLKVDHAEKWFRWGPEENDVIRVLRNGYDSGEMYLSTIAPENGAYRIYATSAKSIPFTQKSQSFQKKSLSSIMLLCAGECGMGAKQYGLEGELQYEYLLRKNETAPAFLNRLANLEGAVLKAYSGSFVAIGVLYAQELPAMHELDLKGDQMDSWYIDRRDTRWQGVKIISPFGNGSARDSAVNGTDKIIQTIQAEDDAQAKRWARGILLMHNRQAESLEIEMDFNPGYTAMVRIDVNSQTDAQGAWVIDKVRHDFVNGRTWAKMLRCVTTVS